MRQHSPRNWILGLLAVVGTLLAHAAHAAPVEVEAAIKPYGRVSGVSGNLNSVGSDTLNNVMTMWAENFQKVYPNVKIQIEGKGSGTAPPASFASATAAARSRSCNWPHG